MSDVLFVKQLDISTIEILKSQGRDRATFLPLNKLKPAPNKLALPKDKGVIDFAINLMDFDDKYIDAFYFALGEKRILVVSPDGMPKYWIGHEGKDHSFIPEKEGIIDHSGWDGFYAPNSFRDKDGTEETVIRYEKNADRVVIDRTRSNRSRLTDRKQLSCEEIFCEDKNLKLHIFVDYSTVEVFINDCEVISTRAYPDDEKSDEVLLRSKKARIKKLDVYSLKGANIETAENSR